MAEYIEREAAQKVICDYCDCEQLCDKNADCYVATALKAIPAADVVARDCHDRLLAENDELRKERPVRHGRWVWDEESWWHKCSACGMAFGYDGTYELFDHGFQLANYCPNCGAKMDIPASEEGE